MAGRIDSGVGAGRQYLANILMHDSLNSEDLGWLVHSLIMAKVLIDKLARVGHPNH